MNFCNKIKDKKNFFSSFFLIIFCIIIGMFFFLIQRKILLIHWDFRKTEDLENIEKNNENITLHKKVNFYYWKDEKFCFEEFTFVWFSSDTENLRHLINNWISFLHEERILSRKISLDTVSLSQNNQQAYLSFDQFFLDREWSIFKKWCFIEGMFKTIKNSGSNIKLINFLVKHQQMEDDHLDFSQSWPIDGFIEDNKMF